MNGESPSPGRLKLDLAVQGARLDESVRRRKDVFRVPWVRDYVARSVELVLPEEVWVNVPIGERFTDNSPFLLTSNGTHFELARGDEHVDVRVVPQPAYYERSTNSGRPMWQIGTAYGAYLAINPASTCRFGPLGLPCRFCHLASQPASYEDPIPIEDVLETVRAAFAEGAVEFVYLHIGYVDSEDAGIAFLAPYVAAIKKHFDTLVAVQLQPPQTDRWIDRTYAMGVDAISYSVEIHDPELLQRYCGGRAELVGRQRYYDALGHAAQIFPNGTVWSDLIVGLEPPESTVAGISALVELGVLPVLSMFRPLDDTLLHDHPLPITEDIEQISAFLFQAVRAARINMNWVRDLGFAITPLDARFFASENARGTGANAQIYRSRLGGMAARNLARLRRRLRVRTVSDSFDSSNL